MRRYKPDMKHMLLSAKRIKNLFFRIKLKLGRMYGDTRYVFCLAEPDKLDRRIFPNEKVCMFTKLSDLTEENLAEIERSLGVRYISYIKDRFSEGGRFYIIFQDDHLGSVVWAKSGRDIPRWLISLDPNDCVLGRCVTISQYRGRGLISRCITAAYDQEKKSGARIFSDCHIWNEPSIRQLKRSGFKVLDRVKV